MNVLLFSPRGQDRNQSNDLLFDIYQDLEDNLALMMDDIEFIPNLALLVLASYMPRKWNIQYVEEDYITPAQSRRILTEIPWDLALVSTVNYNARRGYEVADILRGQGTYTVIGGLHASALPGEAQCHCDTLITGEGEESFCRFLEDFLADKAKPLYQAGEPVDLTQIPPPRYDLISNPKRYNKMPIFATGDAPANVSSASFP